jgi:transcriptional regulator of acetoin/glycerol metabolism
VDGTRLARRGGRGLVSRVAPDDTGLADLRVRFLTQETFEPEHVREPILASWWRSRRFHIPADRSDPPYMADQDLDTPLIHAAEPLLDRLGDQLDGQPISLILTDPTGVLLAQRTGDPDLHRHLESIELLPGFSYGEQFMGTNGIGTTLEDARPTHVFGHEHYAEHLEDLACAAAPIHHPISGKTIGAIDLTCWRRDAGQLLIALARTTAEQVRQALLTHSNIREVVLFQAYLRTCRRTTGIVMAFNDDVVMMNDRARKLLDPADQAVLLGHATQSLADGPVATATIALPTGGKVRLQTRKVSGEAGGDVAGGIVCVKLIESDDDTDSGLSMVPMFLPGVVGSAPLWLRCCHDVDASYGRGEWVALAGEPGVGKYTLARCVHQRRNPTGRVHSLAESATWADDVRRELVDDPPDALIIRHVDRLSPEHRAELVAALRKVRGPRPWVAVTLASEADGDLAELLAFFPRTVAVPPLRRHVDDLNELVPLLLDKIRHGAQLTCSPPAMHLLMRANWPGNVTQLHQVLRQVTQHRRTGAIQPSDLPAEFRAVARRPLNRLESMERDAIVHSLQDANGNKVRAAQFLGMSRATLYRKIHEYGIVTPDR